MDYHGIVNSAFQWLNTRESLKILLPYGALTAVMSLVGILWNNFSKSMPQSSEQYLLGLVVFLVLSVILLLVSFYFVGMTLAFALKQKNRKPRFFGPEEFIEMIKLETVTVFCSLLWCESEKLRKIQLFGFFASLISFGIMVFAMNALEQLLFIIAFGVFITVSFVYFTVIFYASIRYCFSLVIFLDCNSEIMDSIRQSWELTKGSVLQIIFASAVAGFVTGLAVCLVSAAVAFLFLLVGIIASSDYLVTLWIFSVILGILVNWLIIMPQNFIQVSIYENLLAKQLLLIEP